MFRVCFFRAALLALASLSMTGCFWRQSKTEPAFTVRPPTAHTNAVITPMTSSVGRIVSVNPQAKIAVVTFPIGQVPAPGARLSIFRAGQKVGELKMSEESADTLRVGDITVGAAQEGDEVRGP
jgi:hypothetical protein